MSYPNAVEQPTMAASEVALVYGVSTWSIYKTVKDGTCPVEPLRLGRKLRWPTAAVLASVGLDPTENGNAGPLQAGATSTITTDLASPQEEGQGG